MSYTKKPAGSKKTIPSKSVFLTPVWVLPHRLQILHEDAQSGGMQKGGTTNRMPTILELIFGPYNLSGLGTRHQKVARIS